MNNIFSLKRFGQLFAIQFRSHLVPFLIAFGIFVLVISYFNWALLSSGIEDIAKAALLLLIIVLSSFALPFTTSLLASHSFRDYRGRASANMMLMLPASRLEKFSFLYLVYIILIPLCFLFTFIGIEGIALSSFFQDIMAKYSETEQIKTIISGLDGKITYDDFMSGSLLSIRSIAFLWLFLAVHQTIFFLGSSIFKIVPFILTCLVLIGIFILMMILFTVFDSLGSSMIDLFGWNESISDTNGVALIGPFVLLIVLSGISWLRFKKMSLP